MLTAKVLHCYLEFLPVPVRLVSGHLRHDLSELVKPLARFRSHVVSRYTVPVFLRNLALLAASLDLLQPFGGIVLAVASEDGDHTLNDEFRLVIAFETCRSSSMRKPGACALTALVVFSNSVPIESAACNILGSRVASARLDTPFLMIAVPEVLNQ